MFANGPGRAKILITADQDWRDYLDIIVDSIADLGGMACVNTTAVLYEGDPAPLARRSPDGCPPSSRCPPPTNERVLPTQTRRQGADARASTWRPRRPERRPLLGADQVVADLGDGYAALRPAVHLLAAPDVDKLNIELPFPCVWVSAVVPCRRHCAVAAFPGRQCHHRRRRSDRRSVGRPTVANVYCGRHRSYHEAPEIPHDGFLADFLMRNKGFIRD